MQTIAGHILLATLLFTSAAAFAQVDRNRSSPTAADAARGVQRASVVLQLDYDANRSGGGGGQRAIDTQTLNAMLTSSALVDPAAKKALDLAPDTWPRVAQIELLPAGQAAIKLNVIVTPLKEIKLPDNPAQALLDELTSRAKAAVEQAGRRQEQAQNQRRAAIEKDLATAQDKLLGIQSQLREARMNSAGDPGMRGNLDNVRAVTQEMQQIEMNLAASRARLKIIEEETAKLSAATKPVTPAADAKDPKTELKSAWDQLIAAREKAIAAAQNAPNTPESQLAIAQAEAELAEAKIRAATAASAASASDAFRFRALSPSPGFDSSDRWQGERITLRASIAEQEARLGALSERLAQLQKKSNASATTQQVTPYDLDRLQRDEQRASREVDELNQQLDQLRRDRRGSAGLAPKLLVLDGRSGDDAKE
jgi:hypothetical protein